MQQKIRTTQGQRASGVWCFTDSHSSQKEYEQGFPGGLVIKNPPANAGDMGLIPGPERSHMPQSN